MVIISSYLEAQQSPEFQWRWRPCPLSCSPQGRWGPPQPGPGSLDRDPPLRGHCSGQGPLSGMELLQMVQHQRSKMLKDEMYCIVYSNVYSAYYRFWECHVHLCCHHCSRGKPTDTNGWWVNNKNTTCTFTSSKKNKFKRCVQSVIFFQERVLLYNRNL